MRTLTTLSIRSRDGGRPTFLGVAVATGMLFGAMNGALAACPWIVQTHFDGDHQASIDYSVLFDIIRDCKCKPTEQCQKSSSLLKMMRS